MDEILSDRKNKGNVTRKFRLGAGSWRPPGKSAGISTWLHTPHLTITPPVGGKTIQFSVQGLVGVCNDAA